MYMATVWPCRSEPPCIRFWLNISGSVNNCSPPMVETIEVKMIVGRSDGTVIRQNWTRRDAPSMAAAS